jgi:hypothetical protein
MTTVDFVHKFLDSTKNISSRKYVTREEIGEMLEKNTFNSKLKEILNRNSPEMNKQIKEFLKS